MGYYSTPPEPQFDHCARGCAIDTELGEESYSCDIAACDKRKLCIGCIWTCNDCSGDFCEGHIRDANAADDKADTCYVCESCLAKRARRPLVIAGQEAAA